MSILTNIEESDILKSAGGVSHNDVLDILASDNPVISSINSNVSKSTPKGRGRGRGRGRGSANAATNAGSSAPASVGEGMIDLSMYADKAVQLSSPQSKKSNVKIRAPSSSLLPPRPPRPPNIGSGNSHLATTSNSNSDPNFQYDASGSLNLQGIPNGTFYCTVINIQVIILILSHIMFFFHFVISRQSAQYLPFYRSSEPSTVEPHTNKSKRRWQSQSRRVYWSLQS